MTFKKYFSEQLEDHPSMQYQDVIKLCYQATFGAEHLLSDIERAREYLYAEFDSVSPTEEPLFEHISQDVVRVNLGAWKRERRPIEELFKAFVESSYIRENAENNFISYLDIAERVMIENKKNFSLAGWKNFVNAYLQNGICAVHHSEEYRRAEKPSYRIVKADKIKEEWL